MSKEPAYDLLGYIKLKKYIFVVKILYFVKFSSFDKLDLSF